MPLTLVAAVLVLLVGLTAVAVARTPGATAPLAARLRAAGERFVAAAGGRRPGRGGGVPVVLVGLLATVVAVGHGLRWIGRGDTTGWDRMLLDHVHVSREPLLTTGWRVVTTAGDSVVLIPVALLGGALWWWRRRDGLGLALLGGAYLGAVALFRTAKRLVGRARPAVEFAVDRETGPAFPSGHATDAAAVYTAVALLLLTIVGAWALRVLVTAATAATILLVAVSRLYLGAHWVTDVVAGVVLGVAWGGLLWVALTAAGAGPYRRYAPVRVRPATAARPRRATADRS